jgi:hypothetical protein
MGTLRFEKWDKCQGKVKQLSSLYPVVWESLKILPGAVR